MQQELGKVKMEIGKPSSPSPVRKQIHDFTELETWRIARELRIQLYEITGSFPQEERYGLTAQIRRAAVSVTSNVAEGYGRFSYRENIQFCRQSRGSVYELRDHLTTALDAGYIPRKKFDELERMAQSVIRLLNGYIRSTKKLQGAAEKMN